ncbi:hypothetical protein [Arthrobacter alpinus]|nr:hypothetical protein [Arthrobacter alpinus]
MNQPFDGALSQYLAGGILAFVALTVQRERPQATGFVDFES